MADQGDASEDQFSCPICLDPLRDPVTIPCGHSYCMECIGGYWDQDDQRAVCCCPQCRENFNTRPPLKKNTIIAEMMKTLRKTEPKCMPTAQEYSEQEMVMCDVCTGTKKRSVKSCLQCLASFCETHLQPHYESLAFKRHKLVEASIQLPICPHHGKLLEIYCKSDQQCICYLCFMDEHEGHDTISADKAWIKKQEALKDMQKNSQIRLQEKEKELLELKKAMESLKSSTKAAVDDSERIFTELICSIERKRSEVRDLIRAQEEEELSQAEEILGRLENETADLRKRDTEIGQLLQIRDHIQFLQSVQRHSTKPPGCQDTPSISTNPQLSFGNIIKSLSELKEELEEVCQTQTDKIFENVVNVKIILPSLPTTREEFLQYSCPLTLDPKTAHKDLHLSDGNRRVEWCRLQSQTCQDHPNRFETFPNILCKEALCARSYWEVECSGLEVSAVVSYKGIQRRGKGNACRFGHNHLSWRLSYSATKCYFRHNNDQTDIHAPSSSRIGVYLDHAAGILVFYSVADTMTLLHRVETKFTEPLYAGFGVNFGSSVKISEL